jgi:hypothetical protein
MALPKGIFKCYHELLLEKNNVGIDFILFGVIILSLTF